MTADDYRVLLQALLPHGAAWPRDPDAVLTALLQAFADEFARVDVRVEDLFNEMDPRTTYELLEDFERVTGLPDPCVPAEQTVNERRAALVTRLTGQGGQSIAYFLGLAAALGYGGPRWTPISWQFVAAAEGFTATNATITPGATSIVVAASAADPQIRRSGLAFAGVDYRYVTARLKRNAGTGWDGTIYFTTPAHGEVVGYIKTIAAPAGIGGGYVTAVWDMHALTAGGTDWQDSIITGIRLDLGLGIGDDYEIDWVAVSKVDPVDMTVSVTEGVDGVPSKWRVNAPITTITEFTCLSPCTDPLRTWGNERLECVITRHKPAHTTLVFFYT